MFQSSILGLAPAVRPFVAAGILLAALAEARGANYSWQTSVGDWFSASNWNGSTPTIGDVAYIAKGGTATISQLGATCTAIFLGSSSDSGTVQMIGGSFFTPGPEAVGNSGAGTFEQSGGSNSGNDLDLGHGLGATGSYILSGSGSLFVSAVLTAGHDSGTTGTFTLSENGRVSATSEVVGSFGAGTFTQLGGINSCSRFSIGGASATGTYNLNGGLFSISSVPTYSRFATFNFNGGTLQAGGSFSTGLPMTIGTSGGGATFDTAGYTMTLSGSLSGAGSLTKIGGGTLIVAATNTYTGSTTVNSGRLLVNGALAGAETVGGGAILGGTGSLTSATVSAGGRLAPGGGPGVLHVRDSLSLLPGAVLDYELRTPDNSDEVFMPAGALSLNGQQFSDFNFTALAGFGDGSYTLIDAASISGDLGLGTSGTIAGLPATLAIEGNNLVLDVVPEPSAFALLAAALALATMKAAIKARRASEAAIKARRASEC
jgi:fibronectin-binding autotransporter adhesin